MLTGIVPGTDPEQAQRGHAPSVTIPDPTVVILTTGVIPGDEQPLSVCLSRLQPRAYRHIGLSDTDPSEKSTLASSSAYSASVCDTFVLQTCAADNETLVAHILLVSDYILSSEKLTIDFGTS